MRLFPMGFRKAKRRSDQGKERTTIYLNVYDLTPINGYLYWVGLGMFHSGIEGYGVEYGYGAHVYPTSGVFEVKPRSCPGFIFRRSIRMGSTDMTRSEFRTFVEELASKYHGNTYHLIAKNCNHFTDDVCMHLTGKHIPGWVNRLARLGSFLSCLLPEQLKVTTVINPPLPPAQTDIDDRLDAASFAPPKVGEDDVEDADCHRLLDTVNPEVAIVKETSIQKAN